MKRYKIHWEEVKGLNTPTEYAVVLETVAERDALITYINGKKGLSLVSVEEIE